MSGDAGSLALEERIDVLRALSSQPIRNLVCIDASFSFCPMPDVIEEMGFEIPGTDASVGEVLGAIPPAQQTALIAALKAARRTGVGTAEIRFESTEAIQAEHTDPTGLCIVDLLDELGVYVCVVGELVDTAVEKRDLPLEMLRPRRIVHRRDETARFIAIDPLTEALLGWTEDDMLGESALDFIHPDDRDRGIQSWMEMLAGQTGLRYRIRMRTKSGEYRWLEITNVSRLDDPGAGYVETEFVDVDDEMNALARVRAGERQFKTLTESLPVGVVQVDVDARLVFANEWIRRMLNIDPESTRADLESVHPEDRESMERAFRAAIADGELADFDVRIRDSRTRSDHLCRVRVRPLHVGDEVFGAIASIEDMTESASLQSRLREQAETDHLTGLPNRSALSASLQRFLDESTGRDEGEALALLFIDLDGFKLVNDGLGHDAGDELLTEVGRRLTATLRPSDVVARVGGDEFVIVCSWSTDLDGAEQLADRVVEHLNEPFDIAGTQATVSASVGIATHDGTAITADVLIGNADLAMYEAKRAGGGRWERYGDELRTTMSERFEVQRTLNAALANDEFRLFLQPVRHLETGAAVGAECLLRWRHPSRGIVEPAHFIPIAEKSDLILDLGRRILDEACRIGARAVGRHGDDFRISVNVSGRQLAHGGFADEFFETVESHDLKPSHLILEVTETVFVDTAEGVMSELRALTSAGAALALDDFGTGYSSLNHLRVMPVTMLKIDPSYTADLGLDKGTTTIMETIGDLSRRLGLEVVVEGIETAEQLGMVRSMGFELGQGFHLDRPTDEASFFDADLSTKSP